MFKKLLNHRSMARHGQKFEVQQRTLHIPMMGGGLHTVSYPVNAIVHDSEAHTKPLPTITTEAPL